MEQRTENNLVEVELEKSGRGQYERKARGSYNLEKKISVKHYLNKKLNQTPPEYKDSPKTYPVYVQITFLRKTTLRPSNLHGIFTEEEFTKLFGLQEFLDCLQREVDYIKYALRKSYNSTVDSFHKMCEEDSANIEIHTKEYFQELDWGNSMCKNTISNCVEKGLKAEINEFIEQKIVNEIKLVKGREILIEEDFDYFMDIINSKYLPIWDSLRYNKDINALTLLTYFESMDSEFSIIRQRYSLQTWCFNVFYNLFIQSYTEYFRPLDYTEVNLNRWNDNGTFEIDFKNFFSKKSVDVSIMLSDIITMGMKGGFDYELNDYVFGGYVLKKYYVQEFLHKYSNY